VAGYVGGPIIPATEDPWPVMWEQDPLIDNGHGHIWESCLLEADGKHRVRIDEVVRCMVCHAPRCGNALRDPDPCMERRHHRGDHRYLSGRTEKVGA
jgi:hypothetical protein